MHYSVVIVGGGVVGLAAAWRLVSCGISDVLVVEQLFPASAASGLGTGSVHCQRWRPLDVELVLRTKEILSDLERPTNGLTRLKPTGRLTLVGPEDQEQLATYAEMIKQLGVDLAVLTQRELARRFPYLSLDDIAAGAYTPMDGVVSPPSISWALVGLVRQGGGTIWEGVPAQRVAMTGGLATGIELSDGQLVSADQVIVATGPWTSAFLKRSGVSLPDERVVTQNAVIRLADGHPSWSMPNILDVPNGQTTFIPRNPGNVCVGGWAGTAQQVGDATVGLEHGGPSDDFYNGKMLETISLRFRGESIGGVVGGWKGVVDVTPDRLPLLGLVPEVENLFVGCGLGGYGIQRGPAVGEALADLARGSVPKVDIQSCLPGRFDNLSQASLINTDSDNTFSASLN
jgi:sarcosine oxidase subunit beta